VRSSGGVMRELTCRVCGFEPRISLGPYPRGTTVQAIDGRDVADRTVEALRVVLGDEGGDVPMRLVE